MTVAPVETAPITTAEIDRWQTVLARTYGNSQLSGVLVLDGYNVTIKVSSGQLVLIDGTGRHARTRTMTRSDRTVKRIVVLGRSGTLTLDAIRWCNDVGISLSVIDPDGTLAAITAHPRSHEANLRRCQATAMGTALGDRVAALIIAEKVRRQSLVLADLMPGSDPLTDYLGQLTAVDTPSIDVIRNAESKAAWIYFGLWRDAVTLGFTVSDARRVPEHWLRFNGRKSRLSKGTPRTALDPINAVLNYCYALGESIVRHSCHVVGMDPMLGVLHTDTRYRDSMVMDLLEPLRPVIDADVLRYLNTRRFHRTDFAEGRDGSCKLTEAVTHDLTGYMTEWASAIGPTIEAVTHLLLGSSIKKTPNRTPITKSNHHPKPRTNPVCQDCGLVVPSRKFLRCAACRAVEQKRRTERRKAMRRAEHTGTPGLDARRRSSDLDQAWNEVNRDMYPDSNYYESQLAPALRFLTASRIAQETGMSRGQASRVQRGLRIPHRRHWASLATLAESAE